MAPSGTLTRSASSLGAAGGGDLQAQTEDVMTERIRALPPSAVSSVDLCNEQGLQAKTAGQMSQNKADCCLFSGTGRILSKLENLRSELGRMGK